MVARQPRGRRSMCALRAIALDRAGSGSPIDLDEVRVWRPGVALRIFAGLMIGGMAAGVIVFVAYTVAAPEGDPRVPLAVAVPFGLVGFLMWRQTIHPRTSAGPQGVLLRGQWRTVHVPWSAIVRCRAGYHGITITCADGNLAVAPAPQKSNLSSWLGRETRADEAADYLERRARAHQRTPDRVDHRVGVEPGDDGDDRAPPHRDDE